MIIYIIYIFVLGLLIGSFLNVCIYRIPRGESIAYPPSHCTNCGSRIKSYDLIPVISWLMLKGKCRNCGDKISIRYPLVELTTAILYLLTYVKYGNTIYSVKYIVLITFLIIIGMIDFDTTDVYEVTTISGIAVGVIFIIIEYFMGMGIKTYVFGGLLGGGTIAVIILLTKGMGWGDAEICALSGLFLGLSNTVLMMLLSFVTGGIIGMILVLTKIKSRKDYIPFGPFIVIASIFTLFFGNDIIRWYINFVL